MEAIEKDDNWQLCPKCNGDGNLIRYNSPSTIYQGTSLVCDVCNGRKIINKYTGLPPVMVTYYGIDSPIETNE